MTETSKSSIASCEGQKSDYGPGDVVETAFGVGVITDCMQGSLEEERQNETSSTSSISFRVLLWRIPGKSLASSSVAFLQRSAVSCNDDEYTQFLNQS